MSKPQSNVPAREASGRVHAVLSALSKYGDMSASAFTEDKGVARPFNLLDNCEGGCAGGIRIRFYRFGKFGYPILKSYWPSNLQNERPTQVEKMGAEGQFNGRGIVPDV